MGCASSAPAGASPPSPASAPAPEPAPAAPLVLDYDEVIEHDAARQALLEFAKREHSEENLLFFLEIQSYKAAVDDATRAAAGEDIIDKFIRADAKMQVNLPTRITKVFLGDPIKGESEGNYTFTPDLFADAESEVKMMVRKDTFSRFQASDDAVALRAKAAAALRERADC